MEKSANRRFIGMYQNLWKGKDDTITMWNSNVWNNLFGESESRLPENSVELYATVASTDGKYSATLRLDPIATDPEERKRRRHRVFTQCDKCQKWIGVGRIAQHKC